MEQQANRISEKIYTLSEEQLAEVERFLESLRTPHDDSGLIRTMMLSSEAAFGAVWSNPEDEAYDSL